MTEDNPLTSGEYLGSLSPENAAREARAQAVMDRWVAAENGLNSGPFSIGSSLWPGVSKLIEEMGELGQALGKLMATFGAAEHWDGTNLDRRIEEEMADVLAAIAFVRDLNGHRLDADRIACLTEHKHTLFHQWQETQA